MSGFDDMPPGNTGRLRILVLGYIVRCPIGGMAWHHLQYVLGLARLGHQVLFLEDSGDDPWACYDPRTGQTGIDPRYGLEFARRVFDRVGLDQHWAYHDALAGRWYGPGAPLVSGFCRDAEVLINLSGANPLRGPLAEVPIRIYLDTDPLFTQIRILQDKGRRRLVEEHNAHFSFGENLGACDCGVPDDGFSWRPTRQPVDLDSWPVSPGPKKGAFTTVMQWDSYATRDYQGRSYGMKSASFGPYLDLPEHTPMKLELALGSSGAPREQLRAHGWRLRDPLAVTRDPWSYQDFIRHSRGEFSVAKHGYVASKSGWFSERSACYLASGRPVVVQNTGFSALFPVGNGLVPFSDPQQAIESLEAVNADYPQHCEAARAIAENFFDANRVLQSLIDRALEQPIACRDQGLLGARDA